MACIAAWGLFEATRLMTWVLSLSSLFPIEDAFRNFLSIRLKGQILLATLRIDFQQTYCRLGCHFCQV